MDGLFDNSKKEYIITNMKPRRPLINYLWNEEMVCQCDHFGNGFSWMAIGTQRRNIESGSRNVYVKDKISGEIYSANRNYDDLPFEKHECHVGLGYHKVVSEYKGLNTQFTVLVPSEGHTMLYNVKVKNNSTDTKNLSVYYNILPKPALSWHEAYGVGDFSEELNGLYYTHEGFNLPNTYTNLFVAADKKITAYDLAYGNFRGEYNGYDKPIGLKKEKLSCRGATFESEYVAAFQFDIELSANEEFEVNFCASAAQSFEECKNIKNKYLAVGKFEEELKKQEEINNSYLDVFNIESQDEYLNTQANIWLKRQISIGKTWGRLYGKGFRDVMQDITAFVSFDAKLAREKILYALKYQYEDGNPIRMFEPNFKYPYNDGGVWITGAVLSYLNETGDKTILDEVVTYLKGNSFENSNTSDAFVTQPYAASDNKDSVFEHIKKAIDYLLNCRGKNNLVLWRGGDWNDSLNNAGILNKGESVWLSIATYKAINEWQQILKIADKTEYISYYDNKKQELKDSIIKNGMYKDHFIYGINDFNEKLGAEERFYLNPQTWAVLADLTDKNSLNELMDKVEEKLKCNYGYVQCFPSYTKGSDRIGRASYFQPGLVENGSVYNHGVAFKIAADCILGRGDIAYKTLKMISYNNPDNLDNGMEPYAVSNMFIGPENEYIKGFAPMSWITGTAGWLYRCITEFICGIKPEFEGLTVKPCFPSHWDKLKVLRKYRDEIYEIFFERSTEYKLICDGTQTDILPLTGKGNKHKVICYYK